MEGKIWRPLITILLIVVVGICWVAPSVYGYDVLSKPQYQDGDDEVLCDLLVGEARLALWYEEQFNALIPYVEKIESGLQTTMEERDAAFEEIEGLHSTVDDLTVRLRRTHRVLSVCVGVLSGTATGILVYYVINQ